MVGEERLPDFADRDALPYVECVLKEVMRCVREMLRPCSTMVIELSAGGSPLGRSASRTSCGRTTRTAGCGYLREQLWSPARRTSPRAFE